MGSNRPYLIWCPNVTRQNGPRVMMKLAVALKRAGCEVYRYVRQGTPKNAVDGIPILSDDGLTAAFRARAVVVYPEVIAGNPLRIQNVVRWVLFYPGRNGGAYKYYRGDAVFTFMPEFYRGAPQLTPPWLDDGLFFDDGRAKEFDCCFVHKGGRWRDVPETRGLRVITMKDPSTREELAELLRSIRVLYSFDNCSSVLDEAELCGAEVKIVESTGFSNYASRHSQIVREFPQQLEEFLRITSTMDWKGPLEGRLQLRAKLNSIWLFVIKPVLSRFISVR